MMAAARTWPIPGRASSSSTTRIRAMASSVSPKLSSSAIVELPRLQPLLGRRPGSPGGSGLAAGRRHAPAGVRGRKLTLKSSLPALPGLPDRGPPTGVVQAVPDSAQAVCVGCPEPTVWALQKSMDESGPAPSLLQRSGERSSSRVRRAASCRSWRPRAGGQDVPAGGAEHLAVGGAEGPAQVRRRWRPARRGPGPGWARGPRRGPGPGRVSAEPTVAPTTRPDRARGSRHVPLVLLGRRLHDPAGHRIRAADVLHGGALRVGGQGEDEDAAAGLAPRGQAPAGATRSPGTG